MSGPSLTRRKTLT